MPGPVTVILSKRDIIPREVTGGLDTVAVRCPLNPVAAELIRRACVPVAAPSANLSGRPSPTRAEHVEADLCGRIHMIIDGGDCEVGLESTVIKPEKGRRVRLLRPGAVTAEMLRDAGYTVIADAAVTDPSAAGENPASPGMKYRHYSPAAEVILIDMSRSSERFSDAVNGMESGKSGSFAVMCPEGEAEKILGAAALFPFSIAGGEDEARRLFSCLRGADEAGADRIYIPLPDRHGIGLAVYNRVIRAAGGKIIVPGEVKLS